jgi:hypothetical protein
MAPMFARLAPVSFAPALAALALAACTAPKSEICRNVCGRESECIESSPTSESSFDEGECIAACAALERDESTKAIVSHHAACVKKALTCPQVLECR